MASNVPSLSVYEYMVQWAETTNLYDFWNYIEYQLEKNGYTCVKVDASETHPNVYREYKELMKWCQEHYRGNFYHLDGSFWFTTKEQAIHFKLSCL